MRRKYAVPRCGAPTATCSARGYSGGSKSPDARSRAERFATVSAGPVGSSLLLLKHGQMNPVRRLIRKWKLFERKSFWITSAAVFLLCFSFWPYRIGCDCAIEPVKKRFVVAPFAGVFEKSLVRPGDVVEANQKLARMDGRELRMELAGVVADYQRAKKSRDVNVAAGKTGASQIDVARNARPRSETAIARKTHRKSRHQNARGGNRRQRRPGTHRRRAGHVGPGLVRNRAVGSDDRGSRNPRRRHRATSKSDKRSR